MKKIIILLAFLSFALSQMAYAQPTYCLTPEVAEVDENQQVCLDLRVQDFTQLIGAQFTLNFDPTVIQFNNISYINPAVTGLQLSDFGTGNSALGEITMIWDDGQPCQSAVGGVTLPDDAIMFSICFTAIGDYGFHTPVTFGDDPVERITKRVTANCFDIGEFVCDGYVTIGTKPLTINIGSVDGNTGETVCVDFKVEDFNDLASIQYYVFWDTSILEFESALPLNLIPANNHAVNAVISEGKLIVSWYGNDPQVGLTVPDGTQILQVCFKIKGICGQSTEIFIDNDYSTDPPGPIEIVDAITQSNPTGVNIGLLSNEGIVSVNCFDPNSISVIMDDKDVCPGETFFVDVKIEDFSQIVQMMFDLKWNPSIIDFVEVTYPPQSGGPACLPFSNGVNISDTNQGLLHMDWLTAGQGCNKPDGYIVMRLEFMAVGPGGSNSTISVVDPIFVDKFGGQAVNIGINNNNSLVTLCDTNKPTIVAESLDGNPGETICIDFTVQDFNQITSMDFNLSWNTAFLEFANIQALNLGNLTLGSFDQSQAGIGYMGINWANAAGTTLPDGTSIFQLCFRLLGDPGDCALVSFDDAISPFVVTITDTDAGNVGLNGQPGTLCVLNPFDLKLTLPDVFGPPQSTVCLDVTPENFNQMTNTQYTIFWETDKLQFEEIIPANLPNFGPASYDLTDINNGYLNIDWSAANQVLGTSIADGFSLYQVCFKLIGEPTECSPVTIDAYPATDPTIKSATTGNANLNLDAQNGSVCIGSTINLASYVVTSVSCGGNPDGAIDLSVTGGSGDYDFQWSGSVVDPTLEDQFNIGVGFYTVTITDSQNPALQVIQPFTVEYTPDATFADAGADTTRACNTISVILNGGGSSVGPNTTYNWVKLGIGQVTAGGTTLFPEIVGTGCFELTVTTPTCVDKDTVCVSGTIKPIPTIQIADTLSCKADTVILDGTMSPFGFPVLWSGPGVVAGTETFLTPKVTLPGTYIMEMTNPASGCVGSDTIEVTSNFILPNADAGPDGSIGCTVPTAPLGGPGSSTGSQYLYDWVPIGTGILCGNPQAASLNACAPGMYQLTVIDSTNGCEALDTVEIAGAQQILANAGTDGFLDCVTTSTTLDGTGSDSGNQYSYTWTLLPSTIIAQNNLTPSISEPGTYQLQVMDTGTGCFSVDEVLIEDLQDEPLAIGTASNEITCAIDTSGLDATGSAVGQNITYTWLTINGNMVGMGQNIEVNQPGDYQLVVFNSDNGCTGIDTVTVPDGKVFPAADAGDDDEITCNGDPTLEGSYDLGNPELVIIWEIPGQGCISNPNIPNPIATCPGAYVFKVYDNISGCVGTDTVVVSDNQTPPTANAGIAMTLPCPGSTVQLLGSTNATNYSAIWASVSPTGLPITNPTSLNPTVSEEGTYALVVTNEDNGCVSTPSTVLVSLADNALVAMAGDDKHVNCEITTATISANGSTLSGTTVTWQLLNGTFVDNQINTTVGPGVYELIITGAGGCEARDTVEVINDATSVVAVANVSGEISCNNPSVELNANGSTTGNNIIYTWAFNGFFVGNGNTINASMPGVWILEVSNSDNFCVDTASVVVIQDNSSVGEPAQAQADYIACEPTITLVGNLPTGATGLWTTTSSATIDDPTSPTTTASNLTEGDYTFIWTLSIGDCQDYSSAEVTVSVTQSAPNAEDDDTVLQPGTGGQVSINVLENDVFSTSGVSFEVTGSINFGQLVTNDSGEVTFIKEKCLQGKVNIPYKICDLTCPDLCDEAILTIDVAIDPDEACGEIPNAITPNGDGLNDVLVFDQLLNSESYPDNEIIIFNRWGDIVYQAKPYENDWGGTNESGDDLPQATYYYILRLSIADGEIIKGDVTILKK